MEYKYLFDAALEIGISTLELYIEYEKETNMETTNDKLEKFSSSELKKYNVKGKIGDKIGKCYTELLDEDNYKDVLNIIINNANMIDSEEKDFIYDKAYKVDNLLMNRDNINYSQVIDGAIELYQKLKSEYDKISNFATKYSFNDSTIEIVNSNGVDLKEEKQLCQRVFEITIKDDDATSMGYDYYLMFPDDHFDDFKACKKIIKKAIDKLDYRVIKSDKYQVILDNKVISSMLEKMIDSFSAINIQQKKSHLADKQNSQIASNIVNIVEKPEDVRLYGFRTFDDEGVKTYNKDIIKDGVFKTVLYNLKTSAKDATETTANGYSSGTGISVRNLFIVPGEKKLEDAIKDFSGVYITNLEGLNAGLNQTNGDFSLQAEGYNIVDGKIKGATKLIVASGNFFEMLNNVIEIYNDLTFRSENVGAPSIRVSSLDISGK